MPYIIKTTRTRPSADIDWTTPEIEDLVTENEDIFEQVDRELSEDELTAITTFHVDVLRDLRSETPYSKLYKAHMKQNNITRKVEVFHDTGNQIDSWED